ncbi:MAG TPA: 16S rRNA (guanine(527)-N(7))-methyltransferase RsmG [Thiotrichales bacterium]|nr:16S rRNA (guanine(527)-N(7))-methyltransferase RsmG [Thiotrichales bacterium]
MSQEAVEAAGLEARIEQGLEALGLTRSAEQVACLAAYLELLVRWNRVYNLTAVRDPEQMVTIHLLDSLSAQPYLHGKRVADVGSGAGLPGIPLAVMDPRRRFHLVEPSAKKSRFLEQVRIALDLGNVAVHAVRAEALETGLGYDTVISRALGPLGRVWRQAAHLLAPGGRMIFMKGRSPQVELQQLPIQPEAVRIQRVRVPGLDAERHIVTIDMQ